MSLLARLTASARKIKDALPGYRHTAISLAIPAMGVVGVVFGVDSAEYVAIAGFLATLGIFKVKNRPDPVRRPRNRP